MIHEVLITAFNKYSQTEAPFMYQQLAEWSTSRPLTGLKVLLLNNKMPINFVLNDPTPMKYIDPEFYVHNAVALSFLQEQLAPGMHGITPELDQKMIHQWCAYHGFSLEIIQSWFVK